MASNVFEKVVGENYDKFFKVAAENPRRVMLAPSENDFQIGTPLADFLLPPYQQVVLAGTVGVVLRGTCPESGGKLHLGLNSGTADAMTQPATELNPLRNWTMLTKNERPLRIFIPKQAVAATSHELRQYE